MMDALMQAPTVSVAVLNHRRPALLLRVLTAIAQLDYPTFEIVVVGDQPDIASYGLPGDLAGHVKYVHFTEPNICRARNLAVQVAGGEIIAFIDDDAAPEPSWLTELVRPFSDPKIATVGGTVRASDGITLEWQGGVFDRTGLEKDLNLAQDITTRTANEQHAAGTYLALRGVNSAFRRKAVVEVGGFDEAIRYYLDETDMALRLAEAGWSAAIAGRAEVHHLLVPNATRGLLRKPGNQYEIGASKALFCAKHIPEQSEDALSEFRTHRIAMLDPQMRLGIVRTKDRDRIERELEQGILEGRSRLSCHPLEVASPAPAFLALERSGTQRSLNIGIDTGWNPSTNTALVGFSRALSAAGHRVSVFSFKSGPKALRVNYRDGVWRHSGGTWTLPATGEIRAIARHDRADAERSRIHHVRKMDLTLTARHASKANGFIELPGCRQKVTILAHDMNEADAAEATALLQSVADGQQATQNHFESSIAASKTTPVSKPVSAT